MSSIASIVQLLQKWLAQATRQQSHKLINLWFWRAHKLQAKHFMNAKMAIITMGLVTNLHMAALPWSYWH